jgi:hypothetical protein
MAYRSVPALLLLLACGAHPPPPAPDAAPPVAASPPDAGPALVSPGQRQANVRTLLGRTRHAIQEGHLDEAGTFLDQAGVEAGGTHPLVEMVALDRALLLAYRRDFAGAARVLTEPLAGSTEPRDPAFEFVVQNTLVMLHTAEGDLAAAITACDAMTAAGQRGDWATEKQATTLVQLKEHWHRAYLLRMLAVVEKGAKRAQALRDAEKARVAYRSLAAPLGTNDDSIAVLDGFFAVHASDKRAALAAARRVKLAENSDVEDLYLTQMAFDAGGDAASARAVREHIAALHEVSIADAVVRMWLERDAATPERRSPRHPAAPLP